MDRRTDMKDTLFIPPKNALFRPKILKSDVTSLIYQIIQSFHLNKHPRQRCGKLYTSNNQKLTRWMVALYDHILTISTKKQVGHFMLFYPELKPKISPNSGTVISINIPFMSHSNY